MSEQPATRLRNACNTFLLKPTRLNQDVLTEAAEQYREEWIAAQAGARAPKPASTDPGQPAPTSYNRKLETREQLANGVPVKLALQQRTSSRDNATWWCVSWRSKLSPIGPNRRFYRSSGEYWSLPLKTAISLVDELASKGGLDEQYFDRRQPEFSADNPLLSDNVTPAEKANWAGRIFAEEENWGENPYFVVVSDPNDNWRKVLIANRETGVVTFRSITQDDGYMPKKVLRQASSWYLDNSMMDASVQQMLVFKKHLHQLASTRQ